MIFSALRIGLQARTDVNTRTHRGRDRCGSPTRTVTRRCLDRGRCARRDRARTSRACRPRSARSRRSGSSPRSGSGVTDFGITMFPSWMCQRSTTCAGLRPWADGDALDRRVVEELRLSERAPGLGRDPVLLVEPAQLELLEMRVQLDLVDRRHDTGGVDDRARDARPGSSRRRSTGRAPPAGDRPAPPRSPRIGPYAGPASGSGTGRCSRHRASRGSARTRAPPCGGRDRRLRSFVVMNSSRRSSSLVSTASRTPASLP